MSPFLPSFFPFSAVQPTAVAARDTFGAKRPWLRKRQVEKHPRVHPGCAKALGPGRGFQLPNDTTKSLSPPPSSESPRSSIAIDTLTRTHK